MLHGMYLSSLTMGRPKLPFTLIPTLPTTPHSPWKRGSMKPLPLNHWKSLSHYFFEGTFCLISLFSPSGRLIIDKLVLLMMYHRSCCFSSLFFILFSLFSSEWITSMYLLSVSQIPFSACFILQLMLCSCIFISSLDFSVPEFLFGSFIWFLSFCQTAHFVHVLFPWFCSIVLLSFLVAHWVIWNSCLGDFLCSTVDKNLSVNAGYTG